MKISTKGRYALRVMIDLALHSDGAFVSLKDIAIRQSWLFGVCSWKYWWL